MYDIYINSREDKWRFVLGQSGQRMLFVIGLNPSTATKEKSDTTVSKVKKVAISNGFDGFVMLNLYPVRSTDFNELPIDVSEDAYGRNTEQIEKLIASQSNPIIWAAWGENILARKYFVASMLELRTKLKATGASWMHFGSLTGSGHPRHPSRLAYKWTFSQLDIDRYAKQFEQHL